MADRVSSLVEGTGAPPAGWCPIEATERMLDKAHARPEHKRWLDEKDDKGRYLHHCDRCGLPRSVARG